jgi:SNF2-related domain/SNF2 Helicase protein/Helicase conserved C-terminal domain
MFALHGLWRADHRLALWAEDSRSVGVRAEADRRHPFACSAETVAALLGGAGAALEWLMAKAGEGSSTLLIPSRNRAPLPSPELCLLDPASAGSRSAVNLVAWTTPSLLFAPDEAAQLLGELFDPWTSGLRTELAGTGSVDVSYGASLRWLTGAHDLAWRMVGRGQVLPALVTEGAGEDVAPFARWRPTPDGVGWREIHALTAATPPICRAEVTGAPAAGRTAADIVTDLLDVLVDCEARAVMEGRPSLLPAARGKGSAAELWLAALTSGTGRIEDGDPAEVDALRDRLAAWYGSERAETGPLRTSFRLVEPQGPDPASADGHTSDDHWRLEFLVQAVDEPSLLVSGVDLWAGGAALAALERKLERPREAFLADLGRAARSYPELRRALRTARPAGLGLDRHGAIEFLRQAAPVLTAAGFGVLLPSWWQRSARVGLTLTARAVQPGMVQTRSLIRRDAIVAFRWQAAVGDRSLTEQELSELAAARLPLVRLRGQWIAADPDQIAAAVAFLAGREGQDNGGATMAVGEALRIALDPDATAGGLPVLGVDADGRLGDLLSGQAELRLEPAPVPAWFGTTLRPYQERGLGWLVLLSQLGLGAVLADDMGLGKTPQALALLAVEHGPGSRPTLLICPMSLVGNWQREAARFAPMLRVHVHHGSERLTGDELRETVKDADLVITTYGLAQRDAEALSGIGWRRIIADEAQHIKNSATQVARAIRALPADHRIALTGTPVENRLAELHALLDFANPGLFGSAARFRERYSVPIERDGNDAAAAALRRLAGPFVLRRLKSDPAIACDLPEKNEMTVMCNLTVEQAGLYRAVVNDLMSRVGRRDGIGRKGLVLAALSKLKQICNHPAQFLHERDLRLAGRSGKLARLEETLEEALAEGDKVLCFTQFAEFGELLQGYLTERLGRPVLFLHGGVRKRERDELVARFQEPAGPPVFLLSLKAGGIGLNLTEANQVIHIDRWWNPAVEEQATDRAFRIGQRKDVQVRKFVCVGTVEERIDEMIESKRALAQAVVGSGEGWLTELSTDALRELVALSPDAVSE